MRSSLSCETCRRSKVKCVNAGNPPCRKCQRSRISGCTLSRPQKRVLKKSTHRHQQGSPSLLPTSGHASNWPSNFPSSSIPERPANHRSSRIGIGDDGPLDLHLDNLPLSEVLTALKAFTNRFPELGFLHPPSFSKAFQQPRSKEAKTLLAAILACLPHTKPVSPREKYVVYAREMLSESFVQLPNLQVVQALLVMTLFEWGSREFHRAWVYCGIAIRTMQALNTLRTAPYSRDITATGDSDDVSAAIENRTFWTCFIMDRMISSGGYNPPMLPLSELHKLKISPPLTAVQFMFGSGSSQSRTIETRSGFSTDLHGAGALLDISQSFEVLVSGFDIWADVMTFVLNDGRRAPGMCEPHNCPWVLDSPWSKTRRRLETWRASQHQRLHYPDSSVMAHAVLGSGGYFIYINLVYYLCTLMLHREYFPFLPITESSPRGPIDGPKLQAEAPEGWWAASALELFTASENIAKILHEASACDAGLQTPFVGFCAFSAAYMNEYVYRFPRMNLDRSSNAEENLLHCLSFLEDFQSEWKLGESYVTTLRHASIVYQRATANQARYRGKSRADFDRLHRSIHEFRVLDRSDLHLQEIESAELESASPLGSSTPVANFEPDILDLHVPVNDMLTAAFFNCQPGGMWSCWWPPMDDTNLMALSNH